MSSRPKTSAEVAGVRRAAFQRLLELRALCAGLLIAQLSLSACAVPERLPAVPEALTTEARITQEEIAGGSVLRFWVNEDPEPLVREGSDALRKEQDDRARSGQTGPLPPATFLAISGGSDGGAFGAGLLN